MSYPLRLLEVMGVLFISDLSVGYCFEGPEWAFFFVEQYTKDMKQYLQRYNSQLQWILGVIVVVLAVTVWAGVRLVDGDELTVYSIFPLLGLIAFSLMWTHYIHGALRRLAGKDKPDKNAYWYVSSVVVLACILLHPALLSFGLWRDGLGLPPLSYMTAYESMQLAIILGSMSLTIFLAFELHRWFSNKKWWRYVEGAQLVAMLAVFVHALSLGGELNVGWYMAVWWVYGVTLVGAHMYNYTYDKQRREHAGQPIK